MTVTEQTGHSIKGTVNITGENRTMFFSLPYDEGWQVYVDGKRVQTFSVDHGEDKIKKEDGTYEYKPNDDGAFLAAYLPDVTGEHTIEIVYVTPGGVAGVIISGSSMLLLLIPAILWVYRRRHPNQADPFLSPNPKDAPQDGESKPTQAEPEAVTEPEAKPEPAAEPKPIAEPMIEQILPKPVAKPKRVQKPVEPPKPVIPVEPEEEPLPPLLDPSVEEEPFFPEESEPEPYTSPWEKLSELLIDTPSLYDDDDL